MGIDRSHRFVYASPMLGLKIKQARKNRGYTQAELAKKLRCTRELVARYEAGRIKDVPMSRLIDFARVLKVKPLSLMGKQ